MPDLQSFKSAIDEAKSILIVLPENPSQDAVASALALYLTLGATGKQVSTVASTKPLVRDSHLVGLDKISSEVGGNNLVITFNLAEDAVDKVTSNTEGGHLNLVISPKKDGKPITPQDLSFSSSGSAADLIIVVGADSLTQIGALYEKEIELFEKSKIVNFGNRKGSFGSIDMTDPSSSNSELTTALIQELHFPMNRDIAGNLMIGIESATQGLSSPDMTADTFEALAVLYRNGARRSVDMGYPQAKVISDTPIVDVEAKENVRREISQLDKSAETEQVKADWLRPKILKAGQSGPARK
jgi:hypothetical protein